MMTGIVPGDMLVRVLVSMAVVVMIAIVIVVRVLDARRNRNIRGRLRIE